MTRVIQPSSTIDSRRDDMRRRLNRQKAQSGAIAEAVAEAAALKQSYARYHPDLSDEERLWLLSDAHNQAKRAHRQRVCAATHRLVVEPIDDTTTQAKIRYRLKCKVRTCSVCAPLRSHNLHQRLIHAYYRALDRMPGVRALDLTLTQPPIALDDLAGGIDRLHKGIRALFRTPPFKAAMVGRFRNTECVFNAATRTWHVHAHICVICRPDYFDRGTDLYLSYDTVKTLWAEILGINGFVSVSIKAIADRATGATDPQSVARALWHNTKYITKPVSLFKDGPFKDGFDPATNTYRIPTDVADAYDVGAKNKRMSEFAGIMRQSWKSHPPETPIDGQSGTGNPAERPDHGCSHDRGSPAQSGHLNPSPMENTP